MSDPAKKSAADSRASRDALRAVPGAASFSDANGQVIYNLLDPVMQQFLGRCVGAIKKAGVRAKGTGSFSVLLGDDQKVELRLDPFWTSFCESQQVEVFDRVADAAKQAVRV